MGLKVVMGSRYLGGFVGEGKAEKIWLEGKVAGWAESVETLGGVCCKHPQSAYDGLQKSLQQEWAFVQRVNPGIGKAFSPVEKALRETFLRELFEVIGKGAQNQGVVYLLVKQVVLVLPDPTLTDPENWTESCVSIGHLVVALRGQVEFRTADHSACLREGRPEVRWRSTQWAKEALAATIAGALVQGARQLRRVTKIGAWMTVQPSTVNGTALGAQEWRDALFLRYGLTPPDLPKYFDDCNIKFTIFHALNCNRGGLSMACHNELQDRVTDLSRKVFTPFHVREKSLIFARGHGTEWRPPDP